MTVNYISPQAVLPVERAMSPTIKENIILEWVRTEFNLPVSMGQMCDKYYLRIWEGAHVLSRVVDGTLDGFIVHWQSTPEVCRSAAKVACSFRTYNERKYVVIKVWQGEKE